MRVLHLKHSLRRRMLIDCNRPDRVWLLLCSWLNLIWLNILLLLSPLHLVLRWVLDRLLLVILALVDWLMDRDHGVHVAHVIKKWVLNSTILGWHLIDKGLGMRLNLWITQWRIIQNSTLFCKWTQFWQILPDLFQSFNSFCDFNSVESNFYV